MLAKLYKYDFKSTARIILLCMALVIVMSGITKLCSLPLDNDANQNNIIITLTVVSTIGLILSLIALYFATAIVIIQRFYSDMASSGGYLMHSLPVSPAKLILSKLLVAYTWVGLALVTTFLSVAIIFPENLKDIWDAIKTFVPFMAKEFGVSTAYLIASSVLMAILGIGATFGIFFSCIAIGQIANKNKILWAFVSYIVYYFVMQIISFISMLLMFGKDMFADNLGGAEFFNKYMIFELVMLAVIAAGAFVATNQIFKKKLNLQ